MEERESPGTESRERSRRVRLVANTLAFLVMGVVLCLTLYPFDFTTQGVPARLGAFLRPSIASIDGLADDILVNILLFVPLGYALAIFIKRKRGGVWMPLFLVTLAGFLLSLSIEMLQVFLPFRYSSLFDVGSNALGSAIGSVLHGLVGGRVSRSIALAYDDRRKARKWLVIAYACALVAAVTLVAALQFTLRISEVNRTWPLTIGNEPTGSRPWNGTIKQVIVALSPLDAAGVQKAFEQQQLPFSDASLITSHFVFSGNPPYTNLSSAKATLVQRGTGSKTAETGGFTTQGTRWLESKEAGFVLSSFLAASSRFTVLTTVAAATLEQTANARIIAIAADHTKQNFSLVHHQRDLVVRFRTMVTGINGTTPQFVVNDVFRDTLAHTIIATFDAEHLRVYVDNVHNMYSATLGPGFAFFHRLTPWQRNCELSATPSHTVESSFRLLLYLPFGLLLGIAFSYFSGGLISLWQRSTLRDAALMIIGTALPPVCVEWILGWQLDRALNGKYVALGTGIIAATIGVFVLVRAWRQRQARTPDLSFDDADIIQNQLT